MTDRGEIFAWTTIELDSAGSISRFSHEAMNTIFEVIVWGQDVEYAQQAAWAAFDELDQIETELSRFIEGSDIRQINSLRAGRSVTVGIEAMECLQLARWVFEETDGAFDVTACGQARGMNLMVLDEKEFTVTVRADGVVADLGGIGKGWALDRMATVLGEWQIDRAFVHGGRSSACAIGSPAAAEGWTVAIVDPASPVESRETLVLRDRALSGSAQTPDNRHIIDPRQGRLAVAQVAAWAIAPSAALADALSTAFVVMSRPEIERYCAAHPDCDYRRCEFS